MNIIIEEIILNPVLQIEENITEVIIEISEMQTPGADGKSAYESALEGGFVGTELEFNTFLAEIDNKANNSEVVHLATDETISGIKTFFRIVSQIFDYTPITAPAWLEGRSFYDNSAKSLVVYDDINGTSLNVGQELILRARNNIGTTILNGSVVYITGATGQNPTIALAKSNALSTSVTVGMATHDISNNTIGKITTFGLVNDLNTSSFADGALLFLSPTTAGLLTTTVPSSPNYSVYVGIVAYSHINNGKIFIRPEQPISLNTGLTDGNNVTPSVLAVKTVLDNKADLVGGLILQSQLPSYVDDIINGYLFGGVFYNEVGHTTVIVGELGKIYIDITTGQSSKQYRYTGASYIQITNGLLASTNDLPEGVNNLYFTVARFLANLTDTNIKNALGITTLSGSNTGDQDLSGKENISNKATDFTTVNNTLYPTVQAVKTVTDANAANIALKQNALTNPLTGAGSQLYPSTYALQDGTILYHSIRWFTPTSTVSTSGTTVTSVGTQFTSAMVGAKLIINGEWRIITAFTSTTVVTVASAYSVDYSGIVAVSWGVYSKSYDANVNLGTFYTTSSVAWLRQSTGYISSAGVVSSANAFNLFYDIFDSISSFELRWSSSASNYSGTKDLGLRRNASGVLEIYDGITADGAVGNRRDLLARKVLASNHDIIALHTAPASATATGVLGEIRYDANYMYVCTATNTWKRSALTTW
jgi:hypothetical protein